MEFVVAAASHILNILPDLVVLETKRLSLHDTGLFPLESDCRTQFSLLFLA